MLKVLIVEDEVIIRNGLIYALNWMEMGCVVVGSAEDGDEGLRMIEQKRPDVVMTDIRMPKKSGLQMLEEGRNICNFYSIILTGYSEFDLVRDSLRLNAVDYLLKPVDEEELKGVLDKIREAKKKSREMEKISQSRILTAGQEWKLFELTENSVDPYVKGLYEIIKEHYADKLTINDAARQLGVSSSFLSRRLKNNLSTTFTDLLNRYRVRQAIRMLEKGTFRVYEISDRLGFSEYKYFCSVFKKYLGTTPTEFIRNGGGVVSGNFEK